MKENPLNYYFVFLLCARNHWELITVFVFTHRQVVSDVVLALSAMTRCLTLFEYVKTQFENVFMMLHLHFLTYTSLVCKSGRNHNKQVSNV